MGRVQAMVVASSRGAAPSAGLWLKGDGLSERRRRKGTAVGSQVLVNGKLRSTSAESVRWLSFAQMWTIYRRVPDIRAAIDSIVRRVATWDWSIEVQVPPHHELYDELLVEAAVATHFFDNPNDDDETWQELNTKTITDLLVFDQSAIELVQKSGNDSEDEEDSSDEPPARNKKGKPKKKPKVRKEKKTGRELAELVALRGSSIYVEVDEKGRLQGYTQNTGIEGKSSTGDDTEQFTKDQIMFMRLFPNTASVQGNSLMEALTDEITTLLRAAEHVMHQYNDDELPPGILVLSGLDGPSAKKAQQDLGNMKGQDHKVRVITTPDPTNVGARWVQFRRSLKDMELRDVVNDIRRVVWRTFGVLPVEMGITEDIPRATAQAQLDVSSSHLVGPILELLEKKYNKKVLPRVIKPEFRGLLKFRYDKTSKLSKDDERLQALGFEVYVKNGILTRNEVRDRMGIARSTDENADKLTVESSIEEIGVRLNAPPENDDLDDAEKLAGTEAGETDDPETDEAGEE